MLLAARPFSAGCNRHRCSCVLPRFWPGAISLFLCSPPTPRLYVGNLVLPQAICRGYQQVWFKFRKERLRGNSPLLKAPNWDADHRCGFFQDANHVAGKPELPFIWGVPFNHQDAGGPEEEDVTGILTMKQKPKPIRTSEREVGHPEHLLHWFLWAETLRNPQPWPPSSVYNLPPVTVFQGFLTESPGTPPKFRG